MLDIAANANPKPQWAPMVEQIGFTGMTLSIVILVCSAFIFVVGKKTNSDLFQQKEKKKKRFSKIPGPRGLPLIGNIHQIGTEPQKTFANFAKTYGDVFQITIGSRPVIVLNGAKAIRQALITQCIDFAGRADVLTSSIIDKYTGRGITFSTYSEAWKLRRKIGETALRHFTLGKQIGVLEERVLFEAEELVLHWTNGNSEAHIFNPDISLRLSSSNILCSFIFSCRHEFDDEKLLTLLSLNEAFSEAVNAGNVVDFMPWLNFVAPGLLKRFENYIIKFKSWFAEYIESHIANYQSGSDKDILDYLLTVTEGIKVEELEAAGISKETILECVYDFFGAGSETVPVTISWLILYMMKFPDIQSKVHEEIDSVIGRDRKPSLSDRENLPYTEAVIAEALRHSSIVPFTIPHSTIRDTTLGGGYDLHIPKDTIIFANLYSVHHDPITWKDHESFIPERFLMEDGTLNSQLVSSLVSFGAGRRRCVGEGVAKVELFLYFSFIMQKLNVENLESQELSFQGKTGLTTKPLPYNVRISTRV